MHPSNRLSANRFLTAVALIIFLSGISNICHAQFSARMINVVQGNQREYKVYSDLDRYRYEFEESGMKGVVIVHPGENKTYVLMPDQQNVHITTCDGRMSRMNDPWQSYLWFKNYGTEKELGNEKIEGYQCKKMALYQNDSKVFTASFSEKLKFPVTLQSEIEENTYMRLDNIKPWKSDPSFFEIPEGYIEVDERMRPLIPEPPPPETWTEKEITIPFTGALNRGEKLMLHINASGYIKLNLHNRQETPGKMSYTLFENNVPLSVNDQGKEKYRMYRLFDNEKKTLTLNLSEGQDVLLKGYEGSLELEIAME